MRTPVEAFEAMCHCHGEIWLLAEDGWSCIRKNEQNERYTDSDKTEPPLAVYDLLKITQMTRALYNAYTNEAEVLITPKQRLELEASYTLKQIEQERLREAQQDEEDGPRMPVSELQKKGVNVLVTDEGPILSSLFGPIQFRDE